MKTSRVLRFTAGGVFLLAGLLRTLQSIRLSSAGTELSTILLYFLAACCLLGPGRRNIRNLMGTVFLVMFFFTAPAARDLGSALLAMCLLIISAILFSGTLSRVLAYPLTNFIDALYFGNNNRDIPPLTLRLARWYRRSLRLEEALAECERQLDYHPHSLELWCEIVHITRESGDAAEMERQFRRARRRVREGDRGHLDFEFGRYLSA